MTLRPTSILRLATVTAAVLLLSAAAGAWTLDLADSASVSGATVRLADVARGPVPDGAGDLVVVGGGRPGASTTVTARAVLRRLVLAKMADGVALRGSERCHIRFDGRRVAPGQLTARIREVLTTQVPAAAPGAPPSWLELEVPTVDLMTGGDWSVEWPRPRPLVPGRNLITLGVLDGGRRHRLSIVAVLHAYARVATVTGDLARGQDADPDALRWAWSDLAQTGTNVVDGPDALDGMIAARNLVAGEVLTRRDLEARPLVRRGEMIDLVMRRGRVEAVVRATCRQDGLLGQVVTVQNELNGSLVVARVAAAGVVVTGR